ncbi:MAG: hypothetical protein II625_07640 [Bacilli bacterium]|nr:hypothetical protein [Bacilli bacterium]
MKKKLYLLFGLVMSLLLVGIVKAEGPYLLDFETEQKELYAGENIPYKDGYLTFDTDDDDNTYITMYDRTGNVLKTKKLSNKEVLHARAKDNDIYIIYMKNDSGSSFLSLLDEDLEIKETKELGDDWGYNYDCYVRDGVEYIRITEDEVSVVINYGHYSITALFTNRDLTKDFEEKEISGKKELKKYYPEYYGASVAYDMLDESVRLLNYKDGYLAVEGYDYSACPEYATPNNQDGQVTHCYKRVIELIDVEEEEVLWKKYLDNYDEIYEVRILNQYVSTVVESSNQTSILIYDFEGNLVQTIKSNKNSYYYRLLETNNGFIVAKTTCEEVLEPSDPIINHQGGGMRPCSANHEVYYLNKKIDTIVTSGKGKVEVASEQRPGEPVTFTVIPDEGYVIGVIKVTDANGNVITFTKDELKGNTFTMPTADVTIEVEFLVENAKTADIAIALLLILAVLSAIVIVINKRKIIELE